MKRNLLKFLPFFIGALLLTSCGGGDGDGGEEEKPEDTTKPIIENPTTPRDDASNPTVFSLSGPFTYNGKFTDDVELKEVVFSLISLKSATGVDDDPWQPAAHKVVLSDKETTVNQEIFTTIPSNVYTGNYELSIRCTDAAGNGSSRKIIVVIGE